ncbi:hypothetical protein ZYGR_0AI04610 [Zygosaccharomyces rouxii]|uniref:Signal recognition particle receptor subunit beta n=1 Tax=Zygosaccharomyces rouxii TaxID=4956 RepID=A0A1Q3AC03_ZYGRO|nr:hypothetical protein ZYGR_0AI04610 [Zygosaccharomyces rouxii]
MVSNAVLVAIILLLITTAFFTIRTTSSGLIPVNHSGKSTNRQPTFIIAGPSESGKTSLFTLLTSDSVRPSVTSLEPNTAPDFKIPIATKTFSGRLIEFPGHLKLRNKLFETLQNSSNIKGLIFVVDATVDPKELTSTAEFLFEILQVTERFPNGVDILIACNKSESFTARPPLKIRSALEKEIEKIIIRRQKSLETVNGGEKTDEDGNLQEEPQVFNLGSKDGFKFESLEGNIDSVEGSVMKRNIDKWECWMDERTVN